MGDLPRRRNSLRLPGYDYALPGAYFVTCCTHRRRFVFGQVTETGIALNANGHTVAQAWRRLPDAYPHVMVDAFVVMPSHIHGIVILTAPRLQIAALDGGRPSKGDLSAVVRTLKANSTRRINRLRDLPRAPVWQRGFYDHIIRTDRAFDAIRDYIWTNASTWHLDRYNPTTAGRSSKKVSPWD